jgi:predicted aspartyl protease
MEVTMGRVLTELTVENLKDLWDAEQGRLPQDKVRRLTVPDALVDTGATTLGLPDRLIRQLGLARRATKRAHTAAGVRDLNVYEPVRLTVQGRDCTVDVLEVPDTTPVLLGQVPLELLDFVVDPSGRRLIGNPAHGGEQIFELF